MTSGVILFLSVYNHTREIVAGDCGTTKIIVTACKELTISSPLKWLLQRWGSGLQLVAVSFNLEIIKMAMKQQLDRVISYLLSVCDWMG